MIDLVHELEPTVGELLDRHLAATKEWFPHEVVPWGQGRDFDPAEDVGSRRGARCPTRSAAPCSSTC